MAEQKLCLRDKLGRFVKGYIPKTAFKKGYIPWNKGKRSNDIQYNMKHIRIKRDRGKPLQCEMCTAKIDEVKKIELINLDHKYDLNPNDYKYFCTSCHRKWDIKYNNYNNLKIYEPRKRCPVCKSVNALDTQGLQKNAKAPHWKCSNLNCKKKYNWQSGQWEDSEYITSIWEDKETLKNQPVVETVTAPEQKIEPIPHTQPIPRQTFQSKDGGWNGRK